MATQDPRDGNGNQLAIGVITTDMDIQAIAQRSGLVALAGDEVIPSLVTAAALFPNAPATARMAVITIRANSITVRSNGGTPTAGANGIDYATGTYIFPFATAALKAVKAINNSGVATGWIEYWGLA